MNELIDVLSSKAFKGVKETAMEKVKKLMDAIVHYHSGSQAALIEMHMEMDLLLGVYFAKKESTEQVMKGASTCRCGPNTACTTCVCTGKKAGGFAICSDACGCACSNRLSVVVEKYVEGRGAQLAQGGMEQLSLDPPVTKKAKKAKSVRLASQKKSKKIVESEAEESEAEESEMEELEQDSEEESEEESDSDDSDYTESEEEQKEEKKPKKAKKTKSPKKEAKKEKEVKKAKKSKKKEETDEEEEEETPKKKKTQKKVLQEDSD